MLWPTNKKGQDPFDRRKVAFTFESAGFLRLVRHIDLQLKIYAILDDEGHDLIRNTTAFTICPSRKLWPSNVLQ